MDLYLFSIFTCSPSLPVLRLYLFSIFTCSPSLPVLHLYLFSISTCSPSLPHLHLLPLLPSECEASEDSSGEAELEAELEAEPETSDLEDLRELHPGALLYRASRARNLPVMAEALAHGADVNAASGEDEGKTPLIQAVTGVSLCQGAVRRRPDSTGVPGGPPVVTVSPETSVVLILP